MKILQITFNLSPGGAERFVVDLSNELSRDNKVVLLTLMDDSDDPEKNKFYLSDLNGSVQYKNLGIKRGAGFSLITLFKVYKAMRRENADVIHLHVHGVINFCILGIILLCWSTTIVQTIHTDFKIGHSSFLYRFLFSTLGRLHRMRWAALSETNYKDAMTAYPYLLCRRIDNGRAPIVPTDKYYDVKKEIEAYKDDTNSIVFLHVARCVAVKNQKMLVRAFDSFRKKGNDAILLIIGADFDTEEGLEIKKMSGDGIYFLGTRKNISDYMLNSDCFCLSSLYEGLPITIIEAMLSGIPVVSTPVKGAIDVIREGETGVISKDFTADCYLKALEDVCLNLEQLKIRSREESIISPYTISNCARQYMEFYNQKN